LSNGASLAVFKSMFSKENENGVVILDNDPKVVKCFLEFIYTDGVELEEEEGAAKLMAMADEYREFTKPKHQSLTNV
jgi:hypothetical protein